MPSIPKALCVLCAEAKQQTSLTEWCEVKAGASPLDSQKNRPSAGIPQDPDLQDNEGDSVFSQMVISPATLLLLLSTSSCHKKQKQITFTCAYRVRKMWPRLSHGCWRKWTLASQTSFCSRTQMPLCSSLTWLPMRTPVVRCLQTHWRIHTTGSFINL